MTGPADPKMALNALNSGAKVWLADLWVYPVIRLVPGG
nr:hypothetical protein [Geodermatophilus chilensis]